MSQLKHHAPLVSLGRIGEGLRVDCKDMEGDRDRYARYFGVERLSKRDPLMDRPSRRWEAECVYT
jgi:hypothetical protein